MIYALEGRLESKGDNFVILNVNGISFQVYVPTSTSSALGDNGSEVKLFTHLQLKEDGIALYGFSSTEQLELFKLLISVSGAGPKVALALLSALRPEQIAQAITSGNAEVLSQVPGVGSRLAARLILELKGKLGRFGLPCVPINAEVLAALTSLGYSITEARAALAAIPDAPDLTTEQRLKLALRHLAKG
jgi:Holliday junction DNA helicase RuvA